MVTQRASEGAPLGLRVKMPEKEKLFMPKIVFVNEKKEIEVPEGANLREEARKAGIQVYKGVNRYLNCVGHGTCGTCRVLVKKGMENLSTKGRLERFTLFRMFSTVGHEDEMRLSCQVQV